MYEGRTGFEPLPWNEQLMTQITNGGHNDQMIQKHATPIQRGPENLVHK